MRRAFRGPAGSRATFVDADRTEHTVTFDSDGTYTTQTGPIADALAAGGYREIDAPAAPGKTTPKTGEKE